MKNISLPIRFGLVTGIVLIAYFLILGLLDKHTNPVFSFANAVIAILGIYEAIKITKLTDKPGFTYSIGFKTGIITGFVSTLVFTIFFLIYATEINTEFIPKLLAQMKGGLNSGVGIITFVVAIMGFATAVVSTLTIMQLFKNSNNVTQNK